MKLPCIHEWLLQGIAYNQFHFTSLDMDEITSSDLQLLARWFNQSAATYKSMQISGRTFSQSASDKLGQFKAVILNIHETIVDSDPARYTSKFFL